MKVRAPPTGRRLFRTVAIACAVAAVGGGGLLYASWAATGFDSEDGRAIGYLGLLLGATLVAATVMHDPRGPKWAEANGGRPEV